MSSEDEKDEIAFAACILVIAGLEVLAIIVLIFAYFAWFKGWV